MSRTRLTGQSPRASVRQYGDVLRAQTSLQDLFPTAILARQLCTAAFPSPQVRCVVLTLLSGVFTPRAWAVIDAPPVGEISDNTGCHRHEEECDAPHWPQVFGHLHDSNAFRPASPQYCLAFEHDMLRTPDVGASIHVSAIVRFRARRQRSERMVRNRSWHTPGGGVCVCV